MAAILTLIVFVIALIITGIGALADTVTGGGGSNAPVEREFVPMHMTCKLTESLTFQQMCLNAGFDI